MPLRTKVDEEFELGARNTIYISELYDRSSKISLLEIATKKKVKYLTRYKNIIEKEEQEEESVKSYVLKETLKSQTF